MKLQRKSPSPNNRSSRRLSSPLKLLKRDRARREWRQKKVGPPRAGANSKAAGPEWKLEVDQVLLDVHLSDPSTGQPCRAWLTTFVDLYSLLLVRTTMHLDCP